MDIVYQLLVGLGTACAVYGGIRADLKNHADGIKSAHKRLDAHIENHGRAA